MTYDSPTEATDGDLEDYTTVVNSIFEWCAENGVPHPQTRHNGGLGLEVQWEINGSRHWLRIYDEELQKGGRERLYQRLNKAENDFDLENAYDPGP